MTALTLKQWLKQQKLDAAAFGRSIGVKNRQTMHKYVHRERAPNFQTAILIVEATGGMVPLNKMTKKPKKMPEVSA